MSEIKAMVPDILICGMSMRLLALETTKSKWATIFVGAKPNRYLVVEMPKVGGAPVKFDDGARWAATFISKGRAYTFNTVVLGHTYRLVPLLFLEYPLEIEVADLRVETRYPVNIPATVKFLIDDTHEGKAPDHALDSPPSSTQGDENNFSAAEAIPFNCKGLVVDLSEGGIMMASATAILPETVLEATLYLPQDVLIKGVVATVKTCRNAKGSYLLGLSFNQATKPDVMGQINNYIRSIENMALRL
ncbi:MAG: flagellar brake domain-containing protein [Candidatus Adiutrix sp.]